MNWSNDADAWRDFYDAYRAPRRREPTARRAVHMRRKRSPVFSESAKHADCSVCGRKSSVRLTDHRARVTCQFCLRLLGD